MLPRVRIESDCAVFPELLLRRPQWRPSPAVSRAAHQCMTTRGVHKTGVSMVTSRMLGVFRTHETTRKEFMSLLTPLGNPHPVG